MVASSGLPHPDVISKTRMAWLEPLLLQGSRASLAPLVQSHANDLTEAVCDVPWKLWYTSIPANFIDQQLLAQTKGTCLPLRFSPQRHGQGRRDDELFEYRAGSPPAGNRRNLVPESVRRLRSIPECKLLLLGHAFDTLRSIAVEFRTHYFNYQSRRGIERLGAKLDGVLRSHQIANNGTLRDTCVYSIVAGEWPTVKAHLTWQMEKPRSAPT